MTWMRGARRHCTADICDTAIEVLSCLKTEGSRVCRAARARPRRLIINHGGCGARGMPGLLPSADNSPAPSSKNTQRHRAGRGKGAELCHGYPNPKKEGFNAGCFPQAAAS